MVWTLRTIDPATNDLPTDVFAGFLPPNNDQHAGEGFVSYRVESKDGLATSTELTAEASIVFDTNDPINTPVHRNTVDVTGPASSINSLPATTATTDFTVSWSGNDEGSGIANYDVFVSVDGQESALWLDDTADTSATYTGESGHTYAFYSVARDNVGHLQEVPTEAQASTSIVSTVNNPPVADVDKTLTVLEDAASTPLGIIAPTNVDGNSLTITVDTILDATKGEVRLADGTAVATSSALTVDQLTGLVFAPIGNANGAAGTFRYTVSDGQGGTDSQTV